VVLYKQEVGKETPKKIALMHDEGTVGSEGIKEQFTNFGKIDKLEIWSNASPFGIGCGSQKHQIGFVQTLIEKGIYEFEGEIFIDPANPDKGLHPEFKTKYCKETETGAFYVKRDGESCPFVIGATNDGVKEVPGDYEPFVKIGMSVPRHDLRHATNMINRCFGDSGYFDVQFDGDAWVEQMPTIANADFLNPESEAAIGLKDGIARSWKTNVGIYHQETARAIHARALDESGISGSKDETESWVSMVSKVSGKRPESPTRG
jgi:hypothetical protein